MTRTSIRGASLPRVHGVLLSLGYYQDKQHQYRKGKFHVIVKAFKKRVDINIHVNHVRWAPILSMGHRARKSGEDLERELDRILKALKKR